MGYKFPMSWPGEKTCARFVRRGFCLLPQGKKTASSLEFTPIESGEMSKKYRYIFIPFFLEKPTRERSGTQVTVVQTFDNSLDGGMHTEGYFMKGDQRDQV
jgi:hypothetical protein